MASSLLLPLLLLLLLPLLLHSLQYDIYVPRQDCARFVQGLPPRSVRGRSRNGRELTCFWKIPDPATTWRLNFTFRRWTVRRQCRWQSGRRLRPRRPGRSSRQPTIMDMLGLGRRRHHGRWASESLDFFELPRHAWRRVCTVVNVTGDYRSIDNVTVTYRLPGRDWVRVRLGSESDRTEAELSCNSSLLLKVTTSVGGVGFGRYQRLQLVRITQRPGSAPADPAFVIDKKLTCPSLKSIDEHRTVSQFESVANDTELPPECAWQLRPKPGHVLQVLVNNSQHDNSGATGNAYNLLCSPEVQVKSAAWVTAESVLPESIGGGGSRRRSYGHSSSVCPGGATSVLGPFDSAVNVTITGRDVSLQLGGITIRALQLPKSSSSECSSTRVSTDATPLHITKTYTVAAAAGCSVTERVKVLQHPLLLQPVNVSLHCSSSSSQLQVVTPGRVVTVNCSQTGIFHVASTASLFLLKFPEGVNATAQLTVRQEFFYSSSYCDQMQQVVSGCSSCGSAGQQGMLHIQLQHPFHQLPSGLACDFLLKRRRGMQLRLQFQQNLGADEVAAMCGAADGARTFHPQLLLIETETDGQEERSRQLALCQEDGAGAGDLAIVDTIVLQASAQFTLLSIPETKPHSPEFIVKYSYEPLCASITCSIVGQSELSNCSEEALSDHQQLQLHMPASLSGGGDGVSCSWDLLADSGLSDKLLAKSASWQLRVAIVEFSVTCEAGDELVLRQATEETSRAQGLRVCGSGGSRQLTLPFAADWQDVTLEYRSRIGAELKVIVDVVDCGRGECGDLGGGAAAEADAVQQQGGNGPLIAVAAILSLTAIGCLLWANQQQLRRRVDRVRSELQARRSREMSATGEDAVQLVDGHDGEE